MGNNIEKSKLEQGQNVLIFHDPITKNQPEGEFILDQCYKVAVFKTLQKEEWTGHFRGETMYVSRSITVQLTKSGQKRGGQDL